MPMTLTLEGRADFTLANFRRVAWEGEEFGPERCPGCGRRLVVEIAFDDAG